MLTKTCFNQVKWNQLIKKNRKLSALVKQFLFQVRNGNLLKSHVSEILVKQIRVNQGLVDPSGPVLCTICSGPSLDLLCSISLMTFSIFSLVVQMESLCPSQFCLAFSKFIFRNASLLSSILPKRNEKIQTNHRLLDLDGRNSQKYLHQT